MQNYVLNNNYNQINRKNEIKEEIIFNYCDSSCGNIPLRVISKIYQLGISIKQLRTMDIEEFGLLYGVKKKDILNTIQSNYDAAINQNYSINSLVAFGLSMTILEQLVSNGFKKLYEVFFITKEELLNKYNISNSSADKIMNIIENCGFGMDDFARIDDFEEYSSNRINDLDYRKAFSNSILDILSGYDYTISIGYLKRKLPNSYNLFNLESFLNEMKDNNLIMINDDYVENYKPSFEEFINSIPDTKEKYKLFKRYYLEGITLRELGEEAGVTRECIRQKIARIDIPKVKEDSYAYFFENYDLKDEEYNKVFGLSYPAIKYLKLTHKKGSKTINDLFDDDNLTDDIRQRVIENMDGMLVIHGEKVVANKTELLKYVLKTVCNCDTYLTSDIIKKLNDLAEEISHPELKMDEKYFHSHFTGLRFICLSSRGIEDETLSGYRYLDKGTPEIKSMITNLNLGDYKDVEINASIIYKSNITLMIENDIRDEYELHSILRYNVNDENIKFGRSPIIVFGNGNRDRQILDMITANSPIATDDLIDLLSETYGYHKNSILTYVGTAFSNYINNGKFSIDSVQVDSETILELKKLLTNDVYFFEDIVDICQKNNIEYSSNILSRYCINQLGFRANGSYMYKKEYSSFKEYIETHFFTNDFENLNNADARIVGLIAFNSFYMDKIKSLEYIEYKYKEFISIKKLESFGITKEDIENFIQSVESFIDKDTIFTTPYLKNKGFKHKLFSYGFDSVFYDSILLNSDSFKYNRSGLREAVFVNVKSSNEPFVAGIINQIMGVENTIKLDNLIEKFKIYGKTTNLATHYYNVIQNTNLKYDPESKSIVRV